MNVIIALVHVFLIFFLAYQLRPKNEELHKIFWTALIFKLISGLLLGVIYIYYYKEGDTLLFFGDAVTLAKLARHNVVEYGSFLWQGDGFSSIGRTLHLHEPRSLLFVKIVSVFSLITADNYWVTSLYLSFLAFLSSWKFVTTMNHFFPEHRMASIVSFLFVPSVVFWTAGVLKDGLAMAAIFFIAHVFITLWMNDKVALASWIGLLISVIILWALKYYYAAILMPILLTSLVIRLLISPALALKKPVVEFFWWSCVFSISLLSVTLLHPNFKSEIFFNLVLQNNLDSVAFSMGEGVIHFYKLQDNLSSFVINAPWALFSGLFRPLVWEAGDLMQGIAAVENLMILMLTVTAIKNVRHSITSKNWLLIYSVIICSFLLCIFLALSTPNFGTLSRYRTSFLPFFIFLITCKNPLVEAARDLLKRKSDALFGS